MTADEFRAAMRVLDEGRPLHTIYEVEDAVADIRPIKDAFWRMLLAAWAVGVAAVIAAPLLQVPDWAGWPCAAVIISSLLSIGAFRNLFVRIPGLSFTELARVASK